MGSTATMQHDDFSLSFSFPKDILNICKVESLPEELRPAGVPLDTYLVGMREGAEFEMQFWGSVHEYAVITSMKGINPLTGEPAGSELRAHGKGTHCPKDPSHGILKSKGYCPVCNMHWPSFNFVRTDNVVTLSGWRTGLNEVRAFVASKDMGLDVASFLSGGVSPSAAIGVSIYRGQRRSSIPWYGLTRPWWGFDRPYWAYAANTVCLTNSSTPRGSVAAFSCSTSEPVQKGVTLAGLNSDTAQLSEMAIGAGDLKEKPDESLKGGVWANYTIDLDNYTDEPVYTFSVIPVPLEYLASLDAARKAKVHTGPFKGIPLTRK